MLTGGWCRLGTLGLHIAQSKKEQDKRIVNTCIPKHDVEAPDSEHVEASAACTTFPRHLSKHKGIVACNRSKAATEL